MERGGPGYTIIDEHSNANQVPHQRGTIAMANTGNPNSAGSQFYICLKAQPHLDGRYTTFGQVIQGMAGRRSVEGRRRNEKSSIGGEVKICYFRIKIDEATLNVLP